MNEPTQDIAAAKTLDGVNIHLGFIVQTMAEMKVDIKETKNQVQSLKDSFITSSVFSEHLKSDEDHEDRIRVIEKFQENLSGRIWGIGGTVAAACSILSVIISHYWK